MDRKKENFIIVFTMIAVILAFGFGFSVGETATTRKLTEEIKNEIFLTRGNAMAIKQGSALTITGAEGDLVNWFEQLSLSSDDKASITTLFVTHTSSIGTEEFRGEFPNLERIVFKDDIKEVGPYAFADLTSLKTVEFIGECGTIHANAFYGCPALVTITYPTT